MRTRATVVAALLAALAVTGTMTRPASAHLAGDLELAKRRVAELEDRITREEATVQSLGSQLKSLAASVGREQGGLDSVQRELTVTRTKITQTKAELRALRNRLRDRARSVYMRGPLEMVGVLLGSQTIGEFVSRVGYASRLADHDGQLVYKARAAQSKLQEQQTRQEQLEKEQRLKVSALRGQQSRITNVFARQMATMAELAQFRAEALHLVSEIEGRIAKGEVDSLRRVAGRGMTISYGAWAASFLTALGAPTSRDNLVAVVAWQAAEGTMATWNPLATTKAMPGATVYNSHGVKNYRSKEQGIEASIMTLRLPNRGYEPVIASLRSGAAAMETGWAINRSLWCRGCAGGSYVVGFIPAVEQYYDRYAG